MRRLRRNAVRREMLLAVVLQPKKARRFGSLQSLNSVVTTMSRWTSWFASKSSQQFAELFLSPLRAGRGEQERARFGSLFGEPATVPPKVPLSLCERERVRASALSSAERVRVRLDCMDAA